MGRRSERLSKQGTLAHEAAGEGDVIQVVSRAFDRSEERRVGKECRP